MIFFNWIKNKFFHDVQQV